MVVKDQDQRTKALDPNLSFIVQAPAGSGKTELLTQRFLVLLAHARRNPEEIVAITFTRKAAAEMRTRVYEALLLAAQNEPPSSSHLLTTWQLARNVLEKDANLKWHILDNPNRLRIFTIDALCSKIAKSAPLISQFGTLPEILEDPTQLYIQAARLLLEELNSKQYFVPALEKLLSHLDNNYLTAQNLFVGMLWRRDQWLSHIMNHGNRTESRALLETGLQNIIRETLNRTSKLIPEELKKEIIILANFSRQQLLKAGSDSQICSIELNQFPDSGVEELSQWQVLVELFMTKAGTVRRTVNKTCGFPPASDALNLNDELHFKQMKDRMCQLLQEIDQLGLGAELQAIQLLPPAQYPDDQWEVVNALISLLPVLVAFLYTIFRDHNAVDFISIAQGALTALGESENPSEVALNLDYQIQHLLVDEFQDTSNSQYRLIELLTQGWQRGDGRTLFVVGDPMQSIYRFREAEVGIFLKLKKSGLGNVQLHPLTLEVNFRSQAGIVNWLNKTCCSIFPSEQNIQLGAISYSPATAFAFESQEHAVQTHLLTIASDDQEADYVVKLIKAELAIDSKRSIAVLVRSRSHLVHLMPAMKKAQLQFQAIDIDRLIYSMAVSDLLSLTKALCHLGDRIAWLAVLRAPWCGLLLCDLYIIANHNPKGLIWESLAQFSKLEGLSADGYERLSRIVPILERAMGNRLRLNFRKWIAQTWYQLGGPATLEEQYEIANADSYLAILEEFQSQGHLDIAALEARLQKSYVHTSTQETNVHVLTIHKAKGLEYDTVIIPGLHKRPANDDTQLLLWLERFNATGERDLIFAPIKTIGQEYDPIYRYIRIQEAMKSSFETTRLLYVAMTRAKQQLHLIGRVTYDDEDLIKEPANGSFLKILWHSLKNDLDTYMKTSEIQDQNDAPPPLKRLPNDWHLPAGFELQDENQINESGYKFEWSLTYLHIVGTVIHQTLQQLSTMPQLSDYKLSPDVYRLQLLQLGVPTNYLESCLELVVKAISNTLGDSRGKWLLNSSHYEARSEYPLTVQEKERTYHWIIDRTFVDEDGYRWIVDYKSTQLLDNDIEACIVKARLRYEKQLDNYAIGFKLIEDRPIKLGLYFPLFSGWCEWHYLERDADA